MRFQNPLSRTLATHGTGKKSLLISIKFVHGRDGSKNRRRRSILLIRDANHVRLYQITTRSASCTVSKKRFFLHVIASFSSIDHRRSTSPPIISTFTESAAGVIITVQRETTFYISAYTKHTHLARGRDTIEGVFSDGGSLN